MPQFDPTKYVDVQERIVRFWSEHPDGALLTELMSPPDDFTTCRYKAIVFKHREDKTPSATGYAFEIAGGGGANRTSHEENCETSAIGRALANMGYATTRDNRPSRQEIEKVNRAESAPNAPQVREVAPRGGEIPPLVSGDPTLASPRQMAMIRGLARQKAIRPEALEARSSQLYSVPLDRLSRRDASDLIKRLEAVPDVEPAPPPPDVVAQDNADTQAMIDDFNTRYPPADLAAKHRQ
jgi:hypothetical protein